MVQVLVTGHIEDSEPPYPLAHILRLADKDWDLDPVSLLRPGNLPFFRLRRGFHAVSQDGNSKDKIYKRGRSDFHDNKAGGRTRATPEIRIPLWRIAKHLCVCFLVSVPLATAPTHNRT